jgi:hypothetical protein
MQPLEKHIRKLRHIFYGWLGVKKYRSLERLDPIDQARRLLGREFARTASPPIANIRPGLLQNYGIRPRGVLHMGVHHPRDVAAYRSTGFAKILFLDSEILAETGLGVLPACATFTDKDGILSVHLTAKAPDSSPGTGDSAVGAIRRLEIAPDTLEGLFKQIGFAPGDFNLLKLTRLLPGLIAAEGLQPLLPYLEVIEINEPSGGGKQDSAARTNLEQQFRNAGFNRAAVTNPADSKFNDTLYLRRPVITMSSFGTSGRFANQHLQYLFLRLAAQKQNAIVQTYDWMGRYLYQLEDPEPSDLVSAIPETEEQTGASTESLRFVNQVIQDFPDTNFRGFFQFHSENIAPYKEFVRTLFTPTGPMRDRLAAYFTKLQRPDKEVIAIHLRRGDYGFSVFFRAPCRWYEAWLRQSGADPNKHILYLCTEDPDQYKDRFPGFEVQHARSLAVPDAWAAYLDFYVLSHADRVATSNSSYSFIAALLNQTAKVFVRPCHDSKALVAYDPWNAPVLLLKELTPDEHAQLALED